jgi:myo-inositol 2-dehydrogenase / D-chiro-inositol 1-dehydrogenase
MGRIGLVHLEAITKAPGVTPVMISNPTVSKAEAAAKQYNIPRFTNDAMEVITDPEGTSVVLFHFCNRSVASIEL